MVLDRTLDARVLLYSICLSLSVYLSMEAPPKRLDTVQTHHNDGRDGSSTTLLLLLTRRRCRQSNVQVAEGLDQEHGDGRARHGAHQMRHEADVEATSAIDTHNVAQQIDEARSIRSALQAGLDDVQRIRDAAGNQLARARERQELPASL